jgi:ABC-2 type transport system ATP-binding protein
VDRISTQRPGTTDDASGVAGSYAGPTLHLSGLTKRFGTVVAVDDLTFDVAPGRVTGFLGPNGAGKTTTLRLLLGLLTPTSGHATIGAAPYSALHEPLHVVGAGLDGSSFHPGRTARNHLRWMCASGGIATSRVAEVLALVGLTEAADRRVGGYSLGMRQRLTLAGAMLGDPQVLILDEPANGLDPEGIAWLRGFLRHLAGQGRTVLVSSHVLSEVQQTVDDVVILARGRLVHTGPVNSLSGEPGVRVLSPDAGALAEALQGAGLKPEPYDGGLVVRGCPPERVGDLAFEAGARLHLLAPLEHDLETAFLRMVDEAERRIDRERAHQPSAPAQSQTTESQTPQTTDGAA